MPIRLSRVLIFAATSVAALGLFAVVAAAPAKTPRDARTAYVLAAMDRRGSGDSLADDAAAAGETGHARPEAPHRDQGPPANQDDPIGAMIASRPAPDEARADEPFDLPYPRTETRRAVHHRELRPPHFREARAAPLPAVRHAPPPLAAERPHRLRIVVQAPPHPALSPEPAAPPLEAALPQVEAGQVPPADLDTRLQALTEVAAADMAGARFELSPDLSAGRDGAVVVRLPGRLLAALDAKAEDSGFGPAARTLSITVALSAQGYAVVPDEALTTEVQPGRPAAFSWRVSPSGGSGGMLSATMTASMMVDGQAVSFPLGVLTAQIPPPVEVAPTITSAPAPAPALAPDLGARLRARLARIGLPDLSRLTLHALAVPGRPTVDLPMLGEVASEKLVAAGLLVLALLFLRSLLQGSSIRAERRRRFEAFDRDYFGDELR